jgi:hypothetical protein
LAEQVPIYGYNICKSVHTRLLPLAQLLSFISAVVGYRFLLLYIILLFGYEIKIPIHVIQDHRSVFIRIPSYLLYLIKQEIRG